MVDHHIDISFFPLKNTLMQLKHLDSFFFLFGSVLFILHFIFILAYICMYMFILSSIKENSHSMFLLQPVLLVSFHHYFLKQFCHLQDSSVKKGSVFGMKCDRYQLMPSI